MTGWAWPGPDAQTETGGVTDCVSEIAVYERLTAISDSAAVIRIGLNKRYIRLTRVGSLANRFYLLLMMPAGPYWFRRIAR